MSQVLPRPRRRFVPFTHRIVAALLLRRELYEEVAADPTTMPHAIAMVCFSAMMQPTILTQEFGAWGMIVSMLFGVIRWIVFVTIIAYPLMRLIAPTPIDYRRLLRCLGFAEAPGLINLLHFFSDQPLPDWFRALLWLWLLAATVVGLRAAAGITTARAVCIGILSFLFYLVVGFVSAIIAHLAPS